MAPRRKYDDDDGRVIAKMNVEGMPWYVPPQSSLQNSDGEGVSGHTPYAQSTLSRKETFWVMMGAVRAGLIVAGIFSAALLIVVLICLAVW